MITCKKDSYRALQSRLEEGQNNVPQAECGLINDIFRLTSSKEEKRQLVLLFRTATRMSAQLFPGLRIANWPAR